MVRGAPEIHAEGGPNPGGDRTELGEEARKPCAAMSSRSGDSSPEALEIRVGGIGVEPGQQLLDPGHAGRGTPAAGRIPYPVRLKSCHRPQELPGKLGQVAVGEGPGSTGQPVGSDSPPLLPARPLVLWAGSSDRRRRCR